MLIKRALDIPSSHITDEKVYRQRREFIRLAGCAAVAAAAGPIVTACSRPEAMERSAANALIAAITSSGSGSVNTSRYSFAAS